MTLLALGVGVVLAARLGAQAGSTTTFTHDANGNLTSRLEEGVLWTYVYDSSDLLREVQRDGVLLESYQYDAEGRRVRKTNAAGIVRYVWDGERIIMETDDFGNTIAKYDYAGDRLLAVHHVTEGTAFYMLDGLGSPVALSRPDGSLAARYKLDAWGVLRQEVGSSSNPFLFTGHLFDEVTGLYYAKARYYDPRTARFLTEDPVKGDPSEPRSLHAYLYAYANPTVYVDPDGRCVGSLQRSDEFCQTIARGMAYVIGGDPEADVARQIERRAKVVEGRRRFRQQTGRDPLPDEVVWSEPGRALTSSFREIDTTGRIDPDHAEWVAVGGGVSTRIAVGSARAAGATTAEQVLAGVTQLGDEAIGQVTGVSPGDVADLTRLARQGLAPRPPPGARTPDVVVVGESATRPGVDFLPAHSARHSSADLDPAPPPPHTGGVAGEQPRDTLGRFLSRTHPGQRISGASAVDDFIAQAQDNGFDLVGREVSINTPFGQRRYDVVLINRETGRTHAFEIKSSQEAFDKFDQAARQQVAADRWLNRQGGAQAVGSFEGIEIQDATKILWELP